MVDIDAISIDPEFLRLIPRSVAADLCALPLSVENGTLLVALPENFDPQVLNDLAFLTGKKINAETFPAASLATAIERLYGSKNIDAKRSKFVGGSEVSALKNGDGRNDLSNDGSIVGLVDRIISDAIHVRASDIHVEPYERSVRVRYRLDGVLQEVLHPRPQKAKAIISRLKIMADLDIAEKRRPQDGRIRIKEDSGIIDIRVSTLPTDFGEKIVLRILDKSQLQLDLTKLGFEPHDLTLFQRIIRLPFGMILVTGPTGSGKTTTLYAALNHINSSQVNITTIEDPIEYNLPGINQTHVRSEIDVTFAAALRSILRQDPNVIMVGEIRDSETAEIAIRAALTGHLVFSTLHTNDAPSAITRLMDMGIEPFLLGSSVKMIIAQRLLRKLCDSCKRHTEPTQDQVEELHIQPGARFYGAKGCSACNSVGYSGRTAVYELLRIQNGLSDLVVKGMNASEFRSRAQSNGMVTLREAAIRKAERGETSLEEVVRETAS
jgi:type IV pilus assembly protein PilB